MRARQLALGILLIGVLGPVVHAQTVEVNRQNRTVEVIATERAQATADVANITLGCVAYGQTHDQAYQAELKIADQVIKALTAAGLQKDQIESSNVDLNETYSGDAQRPGVDKNRQFRAMQTWTVRVSVPEAQKIVDAAVQAGANGIQNVDWDVANPEALEAKARAAAMQNARMTAMEMAQGGGGKLGDMLFASNSVNGTIVDLPIEARKFAPLAARAGSAEPQFSLQLFPEKIEKQATVRMVFALE